MLCAALSVMVGLSAANTVSAMAYANRVQGVVDLAVVYAHERSLRVGIPQAASLKTQVSNFLANAPSAKRIRVTWVSARTLGARSELEICAEFRFPLAPGKGSICKSAKAESFLVG